MKRINKFRGKRIDNREWIYGSLVKDYQCDKLATFIMTINNDFHAELHTVDPNSVGQFTGCLDKNGREVYEGDIVDAWSAGSHCTHGLIRFGCCRFYILLNGDNGPLGPWNLAPRTGSLTPYKSAGVDEHLLIVGNVIDNPDMVAGYLKWCKERNEKWFD